jgi:DNA-binding Lrp family transcriptional regulator
MAKGMRLTRMKIIKRYKADPNPSRLGKRVLHEFKHKAKFKATWGNLMNLLDLAKIQ